MFVQNICKVHYCRNLALSSFDENGNICNSGNYCLDHTPDPGKSKEQIYNFIQSHDEIIGLNCSGMIFKDINMSNKKFIGCNFYKCNFTNFHSENINLKLCIFDYAVFNDCTFIKSETFFTSFSGSHFNHILFTSSDIVQNNFNGIQAHQSSFDDSDLFNSRFIKAKLINTSFRNCNLKKAMFLESYRENVSFKMSNTREAIFVSEGSDISLGKNTDNSSFSNSEVK